MGNEYLIPANSKNSMLILGMFNTTDLIIEGTGLAITTIMLFVIQAETFAAVFTILAPLLTTTFLVVPLPNQHNVRTFIKNVYEFFMNQRSYCWKGWCISHGEESK